MYVRGGYNVYPVEVEAVLSTHPDVAAVVVVPRADDVMGEIGVAVVVPRAGATVALPDLRDFAAPQLAAYKLPEAVETAAELPLTAGEKIDRRALAERFGASNPPAPSGLGPSAGASGPQPTQ
jgi:acyl-CoA synthetase (AMP-forming)/AMP-acid ligase II